MVMMMIDAAFSLFDTCMVRVSRRQCVAVWESTRGRTRL